MRLSPITHSHWIKVGFKGLVFYKHFPIWRKGSVNFLQTFKCVFKSLSKTINKGVNKSLTIYKNNTRIIRAKTSGWEKKFLTESKDYVYEIILFLESRRGWYFKILCLGLLFKPSLNRLYYILGGEHEQMLMSQKIIINLDSHGKENLQINSVDNQHKNKILYSYWANYL